MTAIIFKFLYTCQNFEQLRGLSTEGNLRFKIDRASFIVGNLPYFVFEGNFQVQAPEGLMCGEAI